MPDFQNPAAFLLLLLIPLFFIFRKIGVFSKPSFFVTVSDWQGKSFSWHSTVRKLFSIFYKVLFFLGFLLVVIALSCPIFYRQERVYSSRGTDVVFVLDVSPSMAAKDLGNVTRLETAKNAIKKLVEANPGATFGLVAMGEESAVTVPPTIDRNFFIERLSSLETGQLGNGTALGTGVATAVFHLSSSVAPKKCIVLLTDGENNSGLIHPETAAELSKQNDIVLYVMGLGTKGSVPLEYVDPVTGKNYTGYLNSSYDEELLKKLSITGGGRFFEVTSFNDFNLALNMIINNQNVVQTYHSKTVSCDYYDRLVLAAGILFILSWIIKRIFLKEVL